MYRIFEQANHQNVQTDDQSKVKLNTYLKFAIDYQTIGLLESEFTQEVLTVRSTHVMPVPNKPSCILGILSRHRRVYWAIDLSMLLGLQPINPNNQLYEVILISAHQRSLALIVPNILGTVHFSHEQIENNIFSTPTALKPYIKGYIHGNGKEGIAYLLKAESILMSTILHS